MTAKEISRGLRQLPLKPGERDSGTAVGGVISSWLVGSKQMESDGKNQAAIPCMSLSRTTVRNVMHVLLALLGGYGLKGSNLLFYPRALTFGAPDFLLSEFGNRNCHGERLIALFTHELIYRHGKPLLTNDTHQYLTL